MAGWAAYIKNLLDSSDCISKAAIVSSSDGSIWARSEGGTGEDFNANPEELRKFVGLFEKIEEVPSTGFHLEGKKYIVPRVESNLIFGKQGKNGIFAIKTNMAVLIACFEGASEMGPEGAECRSAVEKLGAYLQQSGY